MVKWLPRFSIKKGDYKDYALTVLGHGAWLFFALVAAFYFAAQAIAQAFDGEFALPAWAWITIVFVCLSVAQFLAYTDVRTERDRLRRYDITQATLTQISEFRQTLIQMQNEEISSAEFLGSWRQRYEDIRKEIVNNISTNISQTEANSFQTLGLFGEVEIQDQPPFNEIHKHWRSRIVRDHFWLDSLVRDYGRRRGRPEASAETPGTIFAQSSAASFKPD